MGMLATMIHEYGHLLALRLMGYRGAIYSNALNMTTAIDYSKLTYIQQRIFFLSGGIFQALIFMTLCIFDRDEEDKLANKMVAIQGLVYALFEGFAHRMWWETGAAVGLLASIIFMVAVISVTSNRDP